MIKVILTQLVNVNDFQACILNVVAFVILIVIEGVLALMFRFDKCKDMIMGVQHFKAMYQYNCFADVVAHYLNE